MSDAFHFTCGDVDVALEILAEQARWLEDTGKKLWGAQDIQREAILSGIVPEQIHVLWKGNEPAGTMTLHWVDPVFWEHVPAGESGFVHKLAVRRTFAGQGCAKALLDHAADLCRDAGIRILRLDTDRSRPKLTALYESNGFNLVGTKSFRDFVVNLYEKKLW